MQVTILPLFKGYREQVAGVVYRRVKRTKAHPERVSGLEILLIGRGPEHGWPAGWWDFPGGGIDESVDYRPDDPSDERTMREAVRRELTQELGLPDNAFEMPNVTEITRTAPFRSESAKTTHIEYSEKRITYITVPFLRNDSKITYHDRITRHCWVPITALAIKARAARIARDEAVVRDETKEAADSIFRLDRTEFFPRHNKSYAHTNLQPLAYHGRTADDAVLKEAEEYGDTFFSSTDARFRIRGAHP